MLTEINDLLLHETNYWKSVTLLAHPIMDHGSHSFKRVYLFNVLFKDWLLFGFHYSFWFDNTFNVILASSENSALTNTERRVIKLFSISYIGQYKKTTIFLVKQTYTYIGRNN